MAKRHRSQLLNSDERNVHATLRYAVFACALLLASCGGGGSSSNSVLPNPGTSTAPLPTSSPMPASAAACTTNSSVFAVARVPQALPTAPPPTTTYSVVSNPSGLPVTYNGSSDGVTPKSITPSLSDASDVVTIGSGTSSIVYCFNQAAYPSATLMYNKLADTTGSIASIATSSVAHAPQNAVRVSQSIAVASSASLPRAHRMPSRALGQLSGNTLLVKYDSRTLASSTRTMMDIERGAGIAAAKSLGPQSGSTLSRVVYLPASRSIASVMTQLSADPAVVSVNRVLLRYPLSVSPVYPNDYDFAVNDLKQWDLYQIQAPYAWGISTGSPSVSIAIIDTGYDLQAPDLRSKVTYSESVVNGVITTDASDPNAAQDTDGHGTNVSGIAAAQTNNTIGVAGTGYNVSLQEYRIYPNDGSSSTATATDEAQAIYDAVSNHANVISLSIGGTQGSGIDPAEYDAIEYALAQNVVVVAAAGNERSSGVTSVDFPAAYPGVIAVGASALNDSANPQVRASATEYVASYSNSGPALALVAPGGDPSSTSDTDPLHWILNLYTSQPLDPTQACSDPTNATQANCLALFAGTSQATPHVSAAAALMLSINPALTPAQVRTVLMSTADEINDSREGAGRLDLYRALAAVSGNAPTAATAPGFQNFRAFAYATGGTATPSILDVTFTKGVQVHSDGTFRIADLPASTTSYRIAVWADTNGDGVIDTGDYIGVSGVCTASSSCSSATGITVAPVNSGYTLP